MAKFGNKLNTALLKEPEGVVETEGPYKGTKGAPKQFQSKYPGTCKASGCEITPGTLIAWYAAGISTCWDCYEKGIAPNLIKYPKKAWKGGKPFAATQHPAQLVGQHYTTQITDDVEETKPTPTHKKNKSGAFFDLVNAQKTALGIDDDADDAPVVVDTQKVKGIRALKELGLPVPEFLVFTTATSLHEVKQFIAKHGGKAFARPCPETPKHGFVDSRIVHSEDHAISVYNEALALDPKAQMVLMPVLPGATSAVLTPSTFGVGAGHDAVTSGKGSLTFPVTVAFPANWKQKAGIKNATYMELVDQHAVQLRDGDMPPKSLDFIPKGMMVKGIIIVDSESMPDLVAFEAWAKSFHDVYTAGHVVWHRNGSPVSHYAVHMRLNAIPYVISHEPTSGEVVEPIGEIVDLEQHHTAFLDGVKSDLAHMPIKETLATALVAIHQATDLCTTEVGSRMFGASVAALFYATAAACHGETRHAPNVKAKVSREYIYKGAWDNPLDARRTLPNAYGVFLMPVWSASFGGKKWAAATAAALEMWDAVIDIGRNGGTVKEVIARAHMLVNMAHNTGWLLNKFLDQQFFNACAAGSPVPFISTSPFWYAMATNDQRLKLKWEKMRMGRWKRTGERIEKARTKKHAEGAITAELGIVQANLQGGHAHIQYQWKGQATYQKTDAPLTDAQQTILKRLLAKSTATSLAESSTIYAPLAFEKHQDSSGWSIKVGDTVVKVVNYQGELE